MKKEKPHNPLEGQKPDFSFDLSQDSSEEKISIIIVHKDTPDYLNICIQSIAVTSINNSYEIIIVDNGSTLTDATDFLDDLAEQGECKVIRNKENLWWSKAANQGVRAADKSSRYFLFMHPDTVVKNPAWMDFMINVSEAQDSGLVGLEMHSYSMDGQKFDFIEEWCMLVSRECWNDCGPFSEELPVVGAPFMFTIAAQMSDFKPQVIKNELVHHYRIFSIDPSDYETHSEQAQIIIPKLWKNLPSKVKKK